MAMGETHFTGIPSAKRTRPGNPASRTEQKLRLLKILGRYAADLQAGDNDLSRPIVTPIASALADYRATVSHEEWRETVESDLRTHPIVPRLHEDPYSSYGFRKPRGYAGDAVLLDFIYGGGASNDLVDDATPVGAALYRECMLHPSFVAIRERRDYLAFRLAALCRSGGRPHILSVACGHLREADPLEAATAASLPGRFVALDQDPVTLNVAQADHPSIRIEAVPSSILTLIQSGHKLGAFDFIYSAGLYDYLSDTVARRLTAKLTTMLRPNGRLLIANMMPDLPAAAYMEAVMDWWLIYRTLPQLKNLADRSESANSVVAYQQRHIVYMEIGTGGML